MPQTPSFWVDTRIYLAVAAALLLVVIFYNKYLAVLGAILLIALYLYGRERHIEQQKAFQKYVTTMAHAVEQLSTYALQNMPTAMALVDEQGKLHWGNQVLSEWSEGKMQVGASFIKHWPELPYADMWGHADRQIVRKDDKYYQVIYKPLDNTAGFGELLALYITDITAMEMLKGECLGNMPVMAYIQIDNYDEVLQGLSDKQRTAILVEVNKLIAEWIVGFDGVLKKYAEDMFLAVLSRKALTQTMNDKFDILDTVRNIHGGNKIPVTISMGVAADRSSFAEMAEKAQAGLDLALGRGGDQVAVDIGGQVHFYGGKAKAVEKNTRVKSRIVAHALREIIGDADTVFIMGHANEDFDSLGSAIGVAKMALHLGKTTRVIVSQNNIAVNKLLELLSEYPEYKELLISKSEAAEMQTEHPLVFVVDTHRPEMTAAPDILEQAERVVVIDHHRRSEAFIANPLLVYLEPSASSTSELVTELLMYFDDDIDLTRIDATALYAGIVVDTKSFAVQTGVRTFDAAAYLRRAGADPGLVRFLFRLDFNAMRARAEILTTTEMLPGGIIIGVCPEHTKHAHVSAAQAADMMLRVDGVRMSIVLFYLEDGIGVSARSQGEFNVQVLMEKLGGGGHQTVAGAQIKNTTLAEVRDKVVELCAQYLEESELHESDIAGRSEKAR